MKLETILSPTELPSLTGRDLGGAACVVFDILRATSTFITALHHGAEKILPVGEISEAVTLKKNFPEALLAGERDGVRIRAAQSGGVDFDLGNSPREFMAKNIRGKTVISTTTNGTRALQASKRAQCVLAAAFLNLTATAEFLRRKNFSTVILVCAGTGDNPASEDVVAAGAMAELLSPSPLCANSNVARVAFLEAEQWGIERLLGNSQNGRRLLANPGLRDDVAFCARRDMFNLVATMDAASALRKIS